MTDDIKSKKVQENVLYLMQLYCLVVVINCALNSTLYSSNDVCIIIFVYIVSEIRRFFINRDLEEEEEEE